MVLMGYNEDKAFRLISDIQAELQHNQLLTHDWGEQFYFGDWSNGDFITRSGTRFMGISMLQDPSGLRNGPYRIDLAVADDLDNRKKARNRVLVREAVENITGALREGMSKDTQRLIIAQNWKVRGGILDMLLDEVKDQPATKISIVNAVDKNGDPTWSRYTREYWEQKRLNTTLRTWEREYMNNPIEDGNIFKAEWIQWKKCLPYREYDSVIVYGDLSYEAEGDFKALVVIGRTGREFHLIDCFVHQCTIGAAVKWVYSFYRQHLHNLSNARLYYEGNAIQASLFREEFDQEGDRQGWYVPIVADMRSKGNKFDRIEKMSAVFERLQFWFNEAGQGNSAFKALIDQILAFEKGSGAHDDGPDAIEGGVWLLNQEQSRRSAPFVIRQSRRKRSPI
jgi:predicted phage terminase large subunit-like protein